MYGAPGRFRFRLRNRNAVGFKLVYDKIDELISCFYNDYLFI